MVTVLFHQTVFGPIHSRRFGTSLGVNLLPNDGKICSFDCIYCEAGYNAQGQGSDGIPARASVKKALNKKLSAMKEAGETLDVITFSGNGEPTIHPEFDVIIADTLRARDTYFPNVKVTVLTNSTMLSNPRVVKALKSVDICMLKLDSAVSATQRLINAPVNSNTTMEGIIADIKAFGNGCGIQTMFLRGVHNGKHVDNTTDAEVEALIEAYKEIQPSKVEIYSIDRKTPEEALEKVSREELDNIAARIREAGIKVEAFG